jgi:signal transduction histidine kinase/ligand-binding sensor domain-containing protein
VRRLGLLFIALLHCSAAWSLDAELTLQQLNHRVFTATDGVPGDIWALAQTTDGTLWLGGRAGLTRFDGVRFVSYPGVADEPLHSTNLSALLPTPDGGLWIGFRLGGASLLKGGHITRYGEAEGFPPGTTEQFAWDKDGSLWAATRLGLVRFDGKRWRQVTQESDLGAVYGVLVDRAGTLWIAALDGLFARVAGESRFREVDRTVRFASGGTTLAASSDGRIWAAPVGKLLRVDRAENPGPGSAVEVRESTGRPLLFDEAGNLWGSTDEARSVQRTAYRDLIAAAPQALTGDREQLSQATGNASEEIFTILEDRERNVWVGTQTNLHRFSRANVVRESAPACSQYAARGFSAAAFAAANPGALWIACGDGDKGHVDEVRDGKVVSQQVTPVFSVAYCDRDGEVWFAGPTALGHLERGRIVTTPLPAQILGRPAQALVGDASGALWLSVSRRSVWRFRAGEWSEYGNLAALPRGFPLIEASDERGILWFGYPNGRIARVDGQVVQLFGPAQGLDIGNIIGMLAQGGEVWVGGELGLARFDGKRFVPISNASAVPFRGVSGIVRARNGDLWLNAIAGVEHITRQEIEHVIRDPAHRVESNVFNYLDGVPGTGVQLRPQPSAIETNDGRIWFSRIGGIISIDATQLVRNPLPPPVTIWALTSGAKRYPNFSTAVQLPVHTTDLRVEYAAGSLTVPERVRFRFKLEGSDRDWQDAGTRREVRYTNLGPGRYTFRVTAANNDGVWNKTGASMDFTILPAFYQTRWFYALCGLAGVLALASLHRMRMHRVAAQVRGKLEERLAERERIARELHDTLLQGMQGLIWRFQAVADRMPPAEQTRQLMEQSLDQADKLLGESRDKVKDLRGSASDSADLAEALAAAGDQFAQLHHSKFRVSVQGNRRELHPIVREESFLIGREALANAFRHADAQTIEAEVTFGDRDLHVRIRDDGRGIDAAFLDAGSRPGHFGLIGMRERAKKLGAQVNVWSKPGLGTEIDLRVPANVAYQRAVNASGTGGRRSPSL